MTLRHFILATTAALLASACSLAPKYEAPPALPAPQEDAYREAGTWMPAAPADAAPRGAWWQDFGDPRLDALQEQLRDSNPQLDAAVARYLQARAVARRAWSDEFPTLDAGASAKREHTSANVPVAGGERVLRNEFSASLAFAWEIDLFGRLRSAADAAGLRADASAGDLAAIQLALQAELAADYFSLRGADATLALLEDTVVAFERARDLTRNRYAGGIASATDVDQANAQFEAARAQLAAVRLQRAQLEHAIAVLLGLPPALFSLERAPLVGDPPPVSAGLPSMLLQRRPDVAGAERRVAAANADIGVARAAWFPVFSLGALAGQESVESSSWFEAPSQFWALGAAAAIPLLDAGGRSALNRQARAAFDEAAANYRSSRLECLPRGRGQPGRAQVPRGPGRSERGRRGLGRARGLSRTPALHGRRRRLHRGHDHAGGRPADAAQRARCARGAHERRRGTGARARRRLDVGADRGAAAAMNELEIKRTCIRDRVRDLLVARILDGTYPAGQRLKELTLAREFNVSQAPIREALRELEASGLVASERYRGTRVRGTDLQEMRESYELRMLLEVRAVELGVPYPLSVIEELAARVAGMSQAFADNDLLRFSEHALQMHRQLVQAGGNRIFNNVWDSLHWEVRGRVALQRIAERREGLRPFIELHQSLLEKLRQSDVPAATAVLRTIFARIARLFSE